MIKNDIPLQSNNFQYHNTMGNNCLVCVCSIFKAVKHLLSGSVYVINWLLKRYFRRLLGWILFLDLKMAVKSKGWSRLLRFWFEFPLWVSLQHRPVAWLVKRYYYLKIVDGCWRWTLIMGSQDKKRMWHNTCVLHIHRNVISVIIVNEWMNPTHIKTPLFRSF